MSGLTREQLREIHQTATMMAQYVKPFARDDQFPEAFCDVVSAQLAFNSNVNCRAQCGRFGGTRHIWVKYDGINYDFTAGQFPQLQQYLSKVDGVDIIGGTDAQFRRLGYIFEPDEQCAEQLREALSEIRDDVFGDCSPF